MDAKLKAVVKVGLFLHLRYRILIVGSLPLKNYITCLEVQT